MRLRHLRLQLAALAPLSAAVAQGESSKVAPVDLHADPADVIVGDSLRLGGTTVSADSTKPVRIVVNWLRSIQTPAPPIPRPDPDTIVAPYRAGEFAEWYEPPREGRYSAQAISPDGTGRATIEFTAREINDWLEDLVDSVEQSVDLASELVDEVTAGIERQPVSPPQREYLARAPALQQHLARRATALADLRAVLETYHRMTTEAPGTTPAFDELRRRLDPVQRDMHELSPQLRTALAETRKVNRLCATLVQLEEGFKRPSALFNLVGNFSKVVIAFAVDLDTSVASDNAPKWCGEGCKFGFVQAVKQRDWIKTAVSHARARSFQFGEYTDNIPGFLIDLSAFVTHAAFDAYCERFEGPAVGSMEAEFTHDGRVWWRYAYRIEGKLQLFYRKGGERERGIAVEGHLVGTGVKFAVWEDAVRVFEPRIARGALLFGGTRAPQGIPFTDFEGVIALQAAPTAFFIPVEGDLLGTTLTLRLQPAGATSRQPIRSSSELTPSSDRPRL